MNLSLFIWHIYNFCLHIISYSACFDDFSLISYLCRTVIRTKVFLNVIFYVQNNSMFSRHFSNMVAQAVKDTEFQI